MPNGLAAITKAEKGLPFGGPFWGLGLRASGSCWVWGLGIYLGLEFRVGLPWILLVFR